MKKHLFAIAVLAVAGCAGAAEEWTLLGKVNYEAPDANVQAGSISRMGLSSDNKVYFGTYGASQLSYQLNKFTPAGAADLDTTPTYTKVYDKTVAVGANGILGIAQGGEDGSMLAAADQYELIRIKADGTQDTAFASTDFVADKRFCGTFNIPSTGKAAMPDSFITGSSTKLVEFEPATGAVVKNFTMSAPVPDATAKHYRDWTARAQAGTGKTDEVFATIGGQLYKADLDAQAGTALPALTPFTTGQTFATAALANTGLFYFATDDELLFANGLGAAGTDGMLYVIDPNTAAFKQVLSLSAAAFGNSASRDVVALTVGGKKYAYVSCGGGFALFVKANAAVSDWSQF